MAGFNAEAEDSKRTTGPAGSGVTLSRPIYIDTSALAKRYLRETGSEEFDRFLGGLPFVSISRLSVVEFRCLLARRRRNREIDARTERRVASALEDDIARGFLEVHPLEDRHAQDAGNLLTKLRTIPLRTLDALHLGVALAIESGAVATADRIFAAAAAALALEVRWFGGPRRA